MHCLSRNEFKKSRTHQCDASICFTLQTGSEDTNTGFHKLHPKVILMACATLSMNRNVIITCTRFYNIKLQHKYFSFPPTLAFVKKNCWGALFCPFILKYTASLFYFKSLCNAFFPWGLHGKISLIVIIMRVSIVTLL